MANVVKFTRSSLGNMTKHFERGLNSEGELVNFRNQEIDTTRSHLNYNLAPTREEGQVGFIKKMIGVDGQKGEVYCMNRKDVNVMASWVVTLPKSFPEERAEEFFRKTYDFLKDRYDPQEKSVVSAYVHMDETTPHLHYAFIPLAPDKKHGVKVRASHVVHRNELQRFHGDLQKSLEKHFGFSVDIQNNATKDGNKSIDELKRLSATKNLEKAQKVLKTANIASRELENLKTAVQDEKQVLQDFKTVNLKMAESSELGMMMPDYAEKITEKTGSILNRQEHDYVKVPLEKWEDKHVAQSQITHFENTINDLVKTDDWNKRRITKLSDENKSLKNELLTAKNIVTLVKGFFKSNPRAKEDFSQYQQVQKADKLKQKGHHDRQHGQER